MAKVIVIKRDNREKLFQRSFIESAIYSAICEVKEYDKDVCLDVEVADLVEEYLEDNNIECIGVEEIQDVVVSILKVQDNEVAIAYQRYRKERERIRLLNHYNIMKKEIIDNVSDENSNANVDENNFSGKELRILESVTKDMALDILPSELKKRHLNTMIYQHDFSKFVLGMHNCFGRETRFITNKGVKSFNDFTNEDKIVVLTHTGEWKNATVLKLGIQKLNKITFKKSPRGVPITIRATENHRWLLKDNTFTDNLKVGEYICNTPDIYDFDFNNATNSEKELWCQGFVVGDGTIEYTKDKKDNTYKLSNRTRLRLCGNKIKYVDRFLECGYGLKNELKDIDDLMVGICENKKNVPNIDSLTTNELIAFIHGLYDADGNNKPNKRGYLQYGIQFSNDELIDFVQNYFEVAGLYISSRRDKTGQVTNYATRKHTMEYGFSPKQYLYNFKVVDVIEDKEEDVWCLDVEDNHTFVLSGGIVTGNCLFPDYVKCLDEGFDTRQGDTKPANKYLSACQLIPVILQLQSLDMFGGAGIANYSIHMVKYLKISIASKVKEVARIRDLDIEVPDSLSFSEARILLGNQYIKAEELINKETEQAHQALITNLVTLQSRSGGQVPFTSVNLGLIDENNAEESAYIIEMFLKELDKGLGKKNRTAIFPITIFQTKKGVNKFPTDPYYYLRMYAQRVANKRLYPTFSNLDWSQNIAKTVDEELQIFGCRTILTSNIHTGDYAKIGRGNLAPSTMNLAYLALYSECDIDKFFTNLDENLELTMQGLLLRYDIMISQTPKVAPFMYENGTILDADKCIDTVEPALKNCSLAVGYLGLAECLYVLTGKYHNESEESQQLGIKIIKRIREFCDIKKQELHMNIGVYPAPAEGLCKTGLDAIRRDFGEIKGITDNEYLTNSHHTRVEDGVPIFQKIDIESAYAPFCNGGNIFHIEIDGVNYNEKAITKAIDYAMGKDIPYVRLSHPIATCMDCGYSMPKYMKPCEKCNSENVENLAIVTGYLTTDISNMNAGKQDEISKRKLNKID